MAVCSVKSEVMIRHTSVGDVVREVHEKACGAIVSHTYKMTSLYCVTKECTVKGNI